MNGKPQKSKQQNIVNTKNVIESINEIGSQVVQTARDETKQIGDEFFRQLLGQQKDNHSNKQSGEIIPGSTIKINETQNVQSEKTKELEKQIFFERRLFYEEKQESSRKLQELKLRLQAVSFEATNLASSTANLNQEVKIAVMQNPGKASDYQINFFESIIKMIVNFREKIDSAVVWMQGQNKRSEKKNFWSQYKKKGSSFLLSGETYSQRSVG